ncbi:hypothetical protein [Oryzifoliimicrobium ureilyticus]|uniref:hypothetical protein n=1 Tax=Oryzifoliimicrobium ureilyticus TaxID=3113724 RepID=UPI00307645F7
MSGIVERDLSRIDLAIGGMAKRYQENVSGEDVEFRILTPKRHGPLIAQTATANGFSLDLIFDLFETDFVLLSLTGKTEFARDVRLRLRKSRFAELPPKAVQPASNSVPGQ